MSYRFFFFIICFSLFYNLSAQEAVWIPVDPGGNGWSNAVYIHPANGDLYFSSDMKLSFLRSTDKAASFTPIANPVTGTIYGIAGNPNNANVIYVNQRSVVDKKSGIWKSQDKGNTWTQICDGKKFGISRGQSGLVDPDNSKVIYWTGKDFAVLRSLDGGHTWKDISQGLPVKELKQARHLNALEMAYENTYKNRAIYYPTNLGLYVKSGFRNKWKLIKNGLPESECSQVTVSSRGVIYAAFPEVGLFKSNDSGKTWIKLTTGLDGKKPLRVVVNKKNPNVVYVATVHDKGVYGSRNGGKTFTLLTNRRFNKYHNWPINYRLQEAVSGMIMFIDPKNPDLLYLDYNKMTVDGGKTWKNYGMKEVRKDRWTGTGLTLLTEYRAVFDPNRPGIVWLGFSDTGLMLSEDDGKTIINSLPFHRGEVNQGAGFRDRLVNTSGSCQAIAVDPDRSTTVYASISMKSASNRASAGGIMIKSVDGGWNWDPITKKQGLADGIVRAIVIDPSSPIHKRNIYVASYGNGIYKSTDGGNNFELVTPKNLFTGNNRRIMDLEISKSAPNVLYMGVGGSYGIRPISGGPNVYPSLKPEMYGGVFKSEDNGESWLKCNSKQEIPNVQDIAVDPNNENVVYAAAWTEEFLLKNKKKDKNWRKGGIFRSLDGGINWELIFESPVDNIHGQGQVSGIDINPVAPEIIYAAVNNYGIYRTLDAGKTWHMVGKKSMSRMQRRYHSITINPHNTAEIWVAHFGNSFSKTIDPVAKAYLDKKFKNSNLVKNGGFEQIGKNNLPVHWKLDQPPVPKGEKEVISVSRAIIKEGKNSVHFYLTQAYTDAPSPYQADNEQRRLQALGEIPVDSVWMKEWEVTGETRSWMYQKINPYFTTLARGKHITIEMDVFIKDRNLQKWWGRGYESGEIERDPPQLYLTEIRDYNVNYMVAETSLEDLNISKDDIKNKWLHVKSEGVVSKNALGLNIVITGVGMYSGPMDIFIDNVKLSIKDN